MSPKKINWTLPFHSLLLLAEEIGTLTTTVVMGLKLVLEVLLEIGGVGEVAGVDVLDEAESPILMLA